MMKLDGGWGWMVVLSSFMLHVIIDGISYAFGVLAADLVQELGSTRQLNGWIASVLVGVTLAGGPVAGAVSARVGYRAAALAGSVIAAAGFAASYFVTTAWPLVLTVGCFVGFGMSLIYLPAIICVGIYFDKYRSTAIGIAVCGSGVGTLVMSPLISFLLYEYTWRGAMLILSAAVLQCAVFAALFRPLELGTSGTPSLTESPHEPAEDQPDDDKPTPLPQPGGVNPHRQKLLTQSPSQPISFVRRASADEGGGGEGSVENGSSLLLNAGTATIEADTKKSIISVPDETEKDKLLEDQEQQSQQQQQQQQQQQFPVADFLSVQDIRQRVQVRQPPAGGLLHPNYRGGERGNRHQGQLTSASLTNVSRPVQFVRSITSLASVPVASSAIVGGGGGGGGSGGGGGGDSTSKKPNSAPTAATDAPPTLMDNVRWLFNFELLTQPAFLVFLLSNLLCSIGFNAPYIYTPDRAQRAGHEPGPSALLVSVIGGANTVGRLGFGWLSDRGSAASRLRLYWASLAVSGLALTVSCLSDQYTFSAACCAAFGFFSGSFVTLTSPVLVDLVGIEKLSDSFGLTLLCQGVGVLAGPPLAGLLYDWKSSFDVAFLVCGCSLIASGLVMVPAHWMLRRDEQRRQLDRVTQEL